MWGVTLEEAKPYLKYRMREILFREAVIAFLIGETEEDRKQRAMEEYCYLCKQANKADCKNCKLKVLE